jgi:hypothetical protein
MKNCNASDSRNPREIGLRDSPARAGGRETPESGGHRIPRQAIVRNAHLMSYKRHFCLSRAGGKNESGGNPAG